MAFLSQALHALSLVVVLAYVQTAVSDTPPSSFPHVYPGQPNGDFSPAWQQYFQVTEKLPNITFDVGSSFAGNIPVQREGHANDTLFFWAFEKEKGSLTAASGQRSNEPWGIWLNGGPGSSSIYGLLFENGPIRIKPDYSAASNNYSWSKLVDYIWIDQPVGVGFSTADVDGYVADEDQMGKDFMGFLGNLVKVFPSLATRPLHLTGESYAGVYIPYIMKAYFAMENPPVKIAKIVIGDGSITSEQVFELVPAVSVLETYPQIIGYDIDVYNYFRAQSQLCGYDIQLTYPQNGIIPAVPLVLPTERDIGWLQQRRTGGRSAMSEIKKRYNERADRDLSKRDEEHAAWKKDRRDLSLRTNGTIDPWYGCLLLDMFIDYAVNYTFPWNLSANADSLGFDLYNIPDALSPEVNEDGSVFLNDKRTRAALHAPTSKDWEMTFEFVFGTLETADPSQEPMIFFTDLATNASAHNIPIVLYSGNNDALISHRSTEIAIQNTTFGGVQGFSRKPSTPWNDDTGKFAGIVHQERNWTYVLFQNSGHMVPSSVPEAAFTFVREFVLGTNTTGLVNADGSVVGGEDPTLAQDIMSGSDEIFYGSGATQSTYVFPSATREAWKTFISTATARSGSSVLSKPDNAATTAAPWIGLSFLTTFISFWVFV